MSISLGYRNISPITDVKYKGIHPREKKKFINTMNENIKEFNSFWNTTISEEINSMIEELFEIDANDGENLQKLLKANGVKISTEEIKKAIEENEISKPNPAKVLKEVSEESRVKLKNFLDDTTKANSQETLEDKTNNAEDFFDEISEKYTNDKVMESCEKIVGRSLAKQFRPILERGKKEKSEKTETEKKLIELINKLLLKIGQNDNMSNVARRRSMSSLNALKKSFVNDDQSAIKRKDISVLKLIIRILVQSDPKLRSRILKEQQRNKSNTDLKENIDLLQKQALAITQSPTASKPTNLGTAVNNMAPILSNPSPAPKAAVPTPPAPPSGLKPPPAPKANQEPKPKKGSFRIPVHISEKEEFEAELRKVKENLKRVNGESHPWENSNNKK